MMGFSVFLEPRFPCRVRFLTPLDPGNPRTPAVPLPLLGSVLLIPWCSKGLNNHAFRPVSRVTESFSLMGTSSLKDYLPELLTLDKILTLEHKVQIEGNMMLDISS